MCRTLTLEPKDPLTLNQEPLARPGQDRTTDPSSLLRMPNANPTPARLPAPIPSANYRSLARRATAPLAALTMALLLFIYSRSSIHAAKRNAARHREADGGQISWANENARRHRRAIAERAGAEGGQGVGKGLQVQAEGLWRQIVSPFLKVDGEEKEKEKGKGKGAKNE